MLAALPLAWMDIELKGDGHGEATAAVLRAARGDAPATAVVSSFEPRDAGGDGGPAAGVDPLAQRGGPLAGDALAGRRPGLPRRVRAVAARSRPSSIAPAREAGLEVAAWTVRRRATFDRLARLGVVACCVEAAALDG